MTYIAMDVHKVTSTLVHRDPSSGDAESIRFYTRKAELEKVLRSFPKPWVVAVEATRQAPIVCVWLRKLGAEVRLVDPTKLHALGKLASAKTDRKDAELMLHALEKDFLPEAYLAPPEVVEARVLTRGRKKMVEMCTASRNFLRSMLNLYGVECEMSDLLSKGAQEEFPEWLSLLPPLARAVVGLWWTTALQLQAGVVAMDGHIREYAAETPVVQALMEHPGIGPFTAMALYAEIGDISRFAGPKQLINYAGLAPRPDDSDQRRGIRRLPTRCNRNVRYVAVVAAQGASRCKRKSSKARATYLRVKAKKGANTAKIAAGREILTFVFWAWHDTVKAQACAA